MSARLEKILSQADANKMPIGFVAGDVALAGYGKAAAKGVAVGVGSAVGNAVASGALSAAGVGHRIVPELND